MTPSTFPPVPSLAVALALVAGSCTPPAPDPLSAADLNLVFVVSSDLAFHGEGDLDLRTTNLSPQGLQRSLRLAPFLAGDVLGARNATAIYALAPATHRQGTGQLPDMVPLATIEQFALLTPTSLSTAADGGEFFTGQGAPINASYSAGPLPAGVAASPLCSTCQGLRFDDPLESNQALLAGLVDAGAPGFHVFSAPWETTRALLAAAERLAGRSLSLPTTYAGPDIVYAVAFAPGGGARLVVYDARLSPPTTFPVLPTPLSLSTPCLPQVPASLVVTGGVGGAVVPPNANTNQTLYLVRHAEQHPWGYWDSNNLVGAGQWRALALADALRDKASPDQVWSLDPAQFNQGTATPTGLDFWSSVGPPMTVEPYAIANGLPYDLVTGFQISAPDSAQSTSDFFFTGGRFSGHKVLVGWMYLQNMQAVNALLGTYFPDGGAPTAPTWLRSDYDTLWVLTLDAHGNLAADFSQCEGIDSASLPVMPPAF